MKTKIVRKHAIALAISMALAGGSVSALADDSSIQAQLDMLKQKIAQLEQALADSQESQEKTNEQLERELVVTQEMGKTSDRVLYEADSGSPVLVSRDGTKTMEIHGRAFIDIAGLPDQYERGKVKDLVDSHQSSEFRKLYLGVEGQFAKNWEYELTIDFAEQAVDLKDANVTYTGWTNNELIMGYQKPAFGLENTSSSRYTLFMSRGVTDRFSDERALGVSWANSPSWGSIKAGVFVPNSFKDGKLEDYTEGETEIGDELIPMEASSEIDRYALMGRTTWAPIAGDSRLVHLGVSGMYINYDDPSSVKIKVKPAAHLGENLVYTKVKDVSNAMTWALEGALMYDNFFFQTEYLTTNLDAEDHNYSFDGYYVAGTWVMTGESHGYKKKNGKFYGVTPRHPLSSGGLGAWELALRYSDINLNDKDEIGGSMQTFTVGLNWYMENNLRAMLNYVHFEAGDYEDSSKYVSSQDGNIIEGRLAFYF